MPYSARVRWRSPTPMREQEVDRPGALNAPAVMLPKPKDSETAPAGTSLKKIKRKRYLNNKAIRRAQQIANKLPPAVAPAAVAVPRPPQSVAPAAVQQQVRKPWKGRTKGKGKGSKKGKKGRGKSWRGRGS